MQLHETGLIITGNEKGGVRAIKATREQLKALNATQKKGSAFTRQHRRELKKTKKSLMGLSHVYRDLKTTAAAYLGLVGLKAIANEFRSFEKGLVGVGKTSDLSGRALVGLGDDITNMSLRVPVATRELLGIAEAAGQLGVRGSSNLERFTETVARLVSATDMTGEDGAKLLARILTVTGEGTEVIDRFGSVIVALGNNFAASESEIVKMTNEVARATAVYNLNAYEAAAIGVAMRQMGVRAEAGGTAVGKAYRAIDEALRGTGDDLAVLQELSGMTREELKKLFDEDATAVFLKFSEGLGDIVTAGGDVTGTLERMGLKGEEILKVLPVIAKRSDELSRALNMAAHEMEDGTALMDESNKAFATFDADILKSTNLLSAYATVVGEDMAEAYREMVSSTDESSASIETIRENVEMAKDGLIILTSVLVARQIPAMITYTGSALSATIQTQAFAAAQAGLTGTSMMATGAVRGLGTVMAFMGGPLGVALVAAAALYAFSKSADDAETPALALKSAVDELADSFSNLTRAEGLNQLAKANQKLWDLLDQKKAIKKKLEEVASKNTGRDLTLGLDAAKIQELQQSLLAVNEAITEQEVRRLALTRVTEDSSVLQEIVITSTRIQATTLETLNDKQKSYIESLRFEHSIMKMSAREQAIQIALRRANTTATSELGQEVILLTGALFDYEAEQRRLAEQAEPFAKAWEEATKRIDAAFAEAWKGSFDSFEDFADSLKDGLKTLLAELAHQAITKPIIVSFTSSGGSSLSSLSSFVGSVGSSSGGGGGILNTVGSIAGASGLNAGLSVGMADAATFLYNTGFEAAGTGLANYTSSLAQTGGSFGVVGGAALNIGAGMAGNYLGGELGSSLFEREQATGLGGTVGGIVGSIVGGPLGAFVGSFLGSMADTALGDKDFDSKRVLYGVTGGGRFIEGHDVTKTGASGLELGLITRRTDTMGLGEEDTLAFLDGFLALDATLTSLATSLGADIDLSGATLTNSTEREYDNGLRPDDFFGTMAKGEFDTAAFEDAPKEFIQAWLDATVDSFDEEMQTFIASLDGTAEEMLTALADKVHVIALQNNFDNLFLSADEREWANFTTGVELLEAEFLSLTGTALPMTREAMQEFADSVDVTNEALIIGLTGLAPAINEYLVWMEGMRQAINDAATTPDVTVEANDWIEYRARQILENHQEEVRLLNESHNLKIKTLQEEHRIGQQLLATVKSLSLSDLSPMTHQERFNFAQAEFAQLQVLAESGDLEAAAGLGSAAQALLKEGVNMYASSEAYQVLFEDVTQSLMNLGMELGGERDIQKDIESLTRQMVSGIDSLGDQMADELSFLSSMATSTGDIADLLNLLPEKLADELSGIIKSDQSSSDSSSGSRDPLRDMYTKGLGREADADGYAYWEGRIANGETIADIRKAFIAAAAGSGESYTAYAKGGIARSPHMGIVAEAGRAEAMIPLDNGDVVHAQMTGMNLDPVVSAVRAVEARLSELQVDFNILSDRRDEIADRQLEEVRRGNDNPTTLATA